MRIDPATIAAVKQKSNILEVVGANVALRKKGRRHWGLCPFHHEKTASFSVDEESGRYHCFGCAAHGDAISFVKEFESIHFTEAVIALADRYGIEVSGYSPEKKAAYEQEKSHRERLLSLMDLAATAYIKCLNSPEGKPVFDYLTGDRRLTKTTIANFRLGYAPPGDRLKIFLLKHGYTLEEMEAAGVIKYRENGGWGDTFRARLMIPVFDALGRVIAFGGRTTIDGRAKYLNSPETILFKKNQVLFASFQARQAIRQQKTAIVVEGYFDAIALHQAGIHNVVACQGTTFSPDALKTLTGYQAEKIIFNFDGDAAGDAAIDRAIAAIDRELFSGVVDVAILRLPNAFDPDRFVREKSPEYYQELAIAAPTWFDWRVSLFAGSDLSRSESFNATANAMVAFLSRITEANRRLFYLHRCAEILCQGDHALLATHTFNLKSRLSGDRDQPQLQPGAIPLRQEAEYLAIRLYLYYPVSRAAFRESLSRGVAFTYEAAIALWDLITRIESEFPDSDDPTIHGLDVILYMVNVHAEDRSLLHEFGLATPDPIKRMQEAIAVLERKIWEDFKQSAIDRMKSGDVSAQADLRTAIGEIQRLDNQRRLSC